MNFIVNDFVDKYPCITACSGPSCELFQMTAECNLSPYNKLPAKDSSCYCGFLTCMSCKSPGHQPITCEMVKKWREDIDQIVDRLNLQWKKSNTKKCPKCNVDIYKNTGCMHMNCYNCKHEFCWLCLGDKAAHQNQHIASCSNSSSVVAAEKSNATEGEKDLNKLKNCVNRFLEHENSIKFMYAKLKEALEVASGKHPAFPIVNKFVARFPDQFNFYLESYRELIAARSFLMHTYPLQYMIKNQQEILLFLEAQQLFQAAIENMTALLEKYQVESFVTEINGMVCPVEDFEAKKNEINAMKYGLNKHYFNLKRELSSDLYIKKVQENVKIDLEGIVKTVGLVKAKNMPEPGEIWTCIYCHKATKAGDDRSSICKPCGRSTYQDSYGAWTCSFCSNPNKLADSTCQNHYCKKGVRPESASGIWECSLCGYQNTKNLSDKCKACSQKGKATL